MILRIRIVTNLLNVFLVFWVMKANKRCPGHPPTTHHYSLKHTWKWTMVHFKSIPLSIGSCKIEGHPYHVFCLHHLHHFAFVNFAFLILRPCLLNHQKLKGILPIITFPFFFNEPLLFHQCFSRASVRSFALWHVVDQFLPMLKRYTLQKAFNKIDYSEDLDQVV